MNIYRRLFEEIRPHWKVMVACLIWSVIMALLEMVPAALSQPLIDDALIGRNQSLLWILGGILLLALLGRTISHYTRMIYTGRLAHAVLYQVRTNLYDHLQKLSLSFYGNKRTGQIMSRVTNDVSILEQFIVEGVRDFTINSMRLILIASILFYHNPKLAFWALIPTIPLMWGTRFFKNRVRYSYRAMRLHLADMSSIVSDTVGGIRVVQIFGQEEAESAKFRAKSDEFRTAGLATQKMRAIFEPSVQLAFGIGQVIIWLVGGNEIFAGRLTPGELVMFSGYAAQFYAPAQSLTKTFDLFANTQASADRIYEVMDTQPDITSPNPATPLAQMRGEVVFDGVTFGYDTGTKALQDVNLHVAPGEMIGLVGPSGSGKSTLVQLISRFYDAREGRVLVDGHDVRELNLADLRHHVSVVPQEPYLFHGTIRDNIAYGRPDASFEEVLEAARAANAHEFIMRLSDGYDSHIGERGAKLSGGQRQRIAIARAILDNPKILILDEATSAVDTESEVLIQTALENLMRGRTTFAIAHRLSTIKNADRIVVLERGRIVEEGPHDELMAIDDGLYRRLVEMQSAVGDVEAVLSTPIDDLLKAAKEQEMAGGAA